MHKQSRARNSFSTPHMHLDVQSFSGKPGSIMHQQCLGKTSTIRLNFPSSSSFSQILLLSRASQCMAYTSNQLMSLVSSVSSPNFLCISSLLAGGMEWGTEKCLMQCKHFSATAKTLVLFWSPVQNIILYINYYEKNCCIQKLYKH